MASDATFPAVTPTATRFLDLFDELERLRRGDAPSDGESEGENGDTSPAAEGVAKGRAPASFAQLRASAWSQLLALRSAPALAAPPPDDSDAESAFTAAYNDPFDVPDAASDSSDSLWGARVRFRGGSPAPSAEADAGDTSTVVDSDEENAARVGVPAVGLTIDDADAVSQEDAGKQAEAAKQADLVRPVPVRPAVAEAPVPPASDAQFGRSWLLEQSRKHVDQFLQGGGDDGVGFLTPEQLATDLLLLLKGDRTDDDVQNALLDLLGFENISFVSDLATHRKEIVEKITEEASRDRRSPSPHPLTAPALPPRPGAQPAVPVAPVYGPGVTITTASERAAQKAARKDAKKAAREKHQAAQGDQAAAESASLLGLDFSAMRQAREQQLLENAARPLFSSDVKLSEALAGPQYPHVYGSNTGGSILSVFGTKYSLPPGTTRTDLKEYEQVEIPIPPPKSHADEPPLVPISAFPEWARRAFAGYASLNRMQSRVFQTAWGSLENMLVCAPTGAGKTDVAVMTVLNTVASYLDERGAVKGDEFKVVYVAPMKALAAEITGKFAKRLGYLGIVARELTGDMQLTKREIQETNIIVTTPEKWDVVTRKSTGDTELVQKVRLLIVDEVHLLHDDRGAVLETLVARTLRQVESSQLPIRLLGLSATLPNYADVAQFLRVNLYKGLFFFDASYRPVPLGQTFVGIKAPAGVRAHTVIQDRYAYEKALEFVRQGKQVMIFVHARKATVKSAMSLRDMAAQEGTMDVFSAKDDPRFGLAAKDMQRSKNKELRELFNHGFGIHHAGMLRSDRNMVEKMFADGLIRVLCCTSTLAWGVNLPAYAVIIKGTQIYDSQKGTFVDLSILDVLQIFGRAGRPQYEDHGLGFILTSHDKLQHYVSAMTQQFPIESQFVTNLEDNLNAEISLGTVTNVDEAVSWLGYTFLYIRMRKNPLAYGVDRKELEDDPLLGKRRRDLVVLAAKKLAKAQMIVFDENVGYFTAKNLGRIASNYYIRHATVEIFNEMMHAQMTEADVLKMVAMSSEFDQMKVRDEEQSELKSLERNAVCEAFGGAENVHGKVNILLQSYISREWVEDFALQSDTNYVAQNSGRILRALFEIALSRNWGPTAYTILALCKSVDKRMWRFENFLAQFDVPYEIITKLEEKPQGSQLEALRDMDTAELGAWIRHKKYAGTLKRMVSEFPRLDLEVSVAPITRTVLRISLDVTPDFLWNDRVHGGAEPFWIWVEDGEQVSLLHSEYLVIQKKQSRQTIKLGFTIPVPTTDSTTDQLPPQIYIRAVSDRWLGSETVIPVSFKHLILPSMNRTQHTELLDLQPLPVSALQDEILEEICRERFQYFNPIQTQVFHTLYRTHHNVLLGAPTGSGKTVAAELAMWAAFRDMLKSKVVYIAPLKALVRERVLDWNARLMHRMGRRLVELTGDVTPDTRTIQNADVIITTPEKWDGISRSWSSRSYVQDVSLVIIDEIHLLGGDRGPILEVIVSRMNYIASNTDRSIRIVGLSTALANAGDLADWLGITDQGLFNFKHSVRPVPLEIHIDAFPGKFYCPRMQSMNKPTYQAIRSHSPKKPVIVFVSSRRQTRLTAQDLVSLCANDDNPKMFLNMPEEEMDMIVTQVKDAALRYSLGFGIGLHHAGLVESDRRLVEELFVNNKIQVLVATSTLAWGINTPAHLVVVKGTEYFDAAQKGYVDFPITDVLQMVGRAGRPQYDNSAVAFVFVQDVKKNFYKKFLFEPFPVESSLHLALHDHLNAEIVAGTVQSKQDTIDYLSWTYLFRRLQMNPTYYGLDDSSPASVAMYLSELVSSTVHDLAASYCVEEVGEMDLVPTTLGRIASYYYLSHRTMKIFKDRITPDYRSAPSSEDLLGDFPRLLRILCDSVEYSELPVRHNEDLMNMDLEKQLPLPAMDVSSSRFGGGRAAFTRDRGYDDSNTKAFLLIEAHLSRLRTLPCSDYYTDTKSVLDQAIRIIQAMVDVAADQGYLSTALGIMRSMQCIKQARWPTDSPLLTLPHFKKDMLGAVAHRGKPLESLFALAALPNDAALETLLKVPGISRSEAQEIVGVLSNMPVLDIRRRVVETKSKEGGPRELAFQKEKDEPLESVRVEAGRTYELKIEARRRKPFRGKDFRVHAPFYPKPQHEGWWLVLADREADDLLALTRVSPVNVASGGNSRAASSAPLSATVTFVAPEERGRFVYSVLMVSDGYLGLDVEDTFALEVR
ncbi:Sec63 Brl domain-containing protein [Hyaloraphidium curvatum]|nr:Sec63 Brl domain-containing protein [Hyaloraphidium curvatum]